MWVPGHIGVHGKEYASLLANYIEYSVFTGPTFCLCFYLILILTNVISKL